MKRLIIVVALTLLLVWNLSVQQAYAKITHDEEKVSFTMSEDVKGFFMADDTNSNYYPTRLGYRFTIFDAVGCILNIKLQRITLDGYRVTLSEKEFKGNHFDFSARDMVSGTPNRNHYLEITKKPGCGDVKIKGVYGFEHDEPDDYSFD